MNILRRFSILGIALVLVAGLVGEASAQNVNVRVVPFTPTGPQPYNPNYYLAPGLTVNQYAYNLSTIGRAMQQVPPYAMGYNPYPLMVNTGPQFNLPNTVQPFVYPNASFYPGYYGNYIGNPYCPYPRVP